MSVPDRQALPAEEAPPAEEALPAEEAVPAARPPVGAPPAAVLATLLCVALLALGVLALRELLVGREVAGTVPLPGRPWLGPLLGSATGVVQGTTAALVGLLGLVLGFALVAAAVGSRPRRSMRLRARHPSDVPVDLTADGVSAVAAEAALGHPEVGTSRATARGRRVVVDVSVDPRDALDAATLTADVTERVHDRLTGLEPQPLVRVRVHGAVTR